MIWIGLTGGIASGKSTAAGLLRKLGFVVIDADQIAKDVIADGTEGFQKVLQAFGPKILAEGPGQHLDRKKLAAVVFSKPAELAKLEQIIHPLVQRQVQQDKASLLQKGADLVFYDVPLLYEKHLQQDFDQVVLVTCSEETQKTRLRSRNSMTDSEIDARLKNQIPLKAKEALANLVIVNEGSVDDLEKKIHEMISKLKARRHN